MFARNVSPNPMIIPSKSTNEFYASHRSNTFVTLSTEQQYIIDESYRQFIRADVINQLEDIIDDFIMSAVESNRDLFLYYTHIDNVYKIYDDLLCDYLFLQYNHIDNVDDLLDKNENNGAIEEQVPKQVPKPRRSARLEGQKEQKGGAPGIVCDGDMILNDDPLLHQAFLTAGICKTYEELAHDFDKPEYLKHHLPRLEEIYNKVISVFVNKLNETPDNDELNKMKSFIQKLQLRRYNKEWNYYTSVLEHIDKTCGSIDDLVIIKTKKIEHPANYADFVTLCRNNFIIKVDNSLYYYSTIDNNPVEPIFTMTDFYCRFSDNPTANKKLWPLLFEPDKEGERNVKTIPTEFADFTTLMRDIKYAPGLLDPKTMGPYLPALFTMENIVDSIPPEKIEQIQAVQAMQNINVETNTHARTFLMDGINNFIQYFGSEAIIRDPNSLSFVQDVGGKFCGVSFVINASDTIQLHYGDTTIQNISDFVKSFHGIIPETIELVNPSWVRLHTFSKKILDGIQGEYLGQLSDLVSRNELLTHIIISLKSFGDSLQVYYAKRMQDYVKNELRWDLCLYISTTDKNVAAESLLIHSDVCVIGTGIRPHNDFSEKYPDFFRVKLNDISDIYKEDGSKTITTNKGTLTLEKAVDNVTNTFFDFLEYVDVAGTSVDNPSFNFTIEEMVDYLTLRQLFFKEEGIAHINNLKEAYISETNATDIDTKKRIKILSDLDKFLKKSLHIIKLCEPDDQATITETGSEGITNQKNLLFQKLDVVTTFIETTVVSQLKHLSSVKNDLFKHQGTFERIAEKINSASFTNICDEDLVSCATKFLNPKYERSIREVQSKYTELLETTTNNIASSLNKLISFKIPVSTRETPSRGSKDKFKAKLELQREQEIVESDTRLLHQKEEIERSLENFNNSVVVLTKMEIKERVKLEKKLAILENKIDEEVKNKLTKHKNSLNLDYVKNKVVDTWTNVKNKFSNFFSKLEKLKGGSNNFRKTLKNARKKHTKKHKNSISKKKIKILLNGRKHSKKQKRKYSKKQQKRFRKNNIIIY